MHHGGLPSTVERFLERGIVGIDHHPNAMQLGVLLFQKLEHAPALGWFHKAWGGGNADYANRLHAHLCNGLSLLGVGDPTDLEVWSGAGITQGCMGCSP